MFIRSTLALVGVALALAVVPVGARAADTGLSIGPALGSTGYGGSLAYALPGGIVIRAQSGNYTYNFNFNTNGNTYTSKLNLSNVLIDGELHPGSKPFYYAVGGLINNNNITATTTSAGVTIGNTNYGAGTANAKVTWTGVAPYVGIGWAPTHGGFGVDLGAAFQGTSTARVTTNIAGVTAADIASAQNQIQNTVNQYQVYPVLSVRYTWGF
jgi:hypothetical protein